MIELDHVTVTVDTADGGRTLLREVTATLTERRVAVIGANGSGKSTLARLVNGLALPTSGRVRVDGLDTASQGRSVRKRVGFVFTDPDAQLVMPTAAEDVALSLRRTQLSPTQKDARVSEVLERFGLAAHAHSPVHALSGGQKQLLALAGVLATEPAVLVCDEPTTLLDRRNRRRVDDLIASLPQQVVLVTHDLDAAARCDRALVVDEGQVVFDGPAPDAVRHYVALSDSQDDPGLPAADHLRGHRPA